MPIVPGGFTVEPGWVEFLDRTGKIYDLFKDVVIDVIKDKLIDRMIDPVNPMTARERQLQDSGDYAICIVLRCIKKEPKWTARGPYMPLSDMRVCIDNQWSNILKKWNGGV
jgi:hypothetical protein